MSSTVFQSFQSKQALPVSQPDPKEQGGGIRRRLSSLSLNVQPHMIIASGSAAAAASWGFCISKSVTSSSAMGMSSIRKWWDWSWDWILSRKPAFARDLEMNEQETAALGCHNKGSWRHVFFKLKSEITRLLGSTDNGLSLPQTLRNNTTSSSSSYSSLYY